MLCEACQNIFRGNFHRLERPYWVGHHSAITYLYEAALAGCSICTVTWDTVLREYWTDFRHCPEDTTNEDKVQMLLRDLNTYEYQEGYVTKFKLEEIDSHSANGTTPDLKLNFATGIHSRRSFSDPFLGSRQTQSVSIFSFFVCRSVENGVALSPVFPVDRSSEDELGWAVHFAKYWLKDCTEKHLLCNSGRVSEFMPTRLLELNAPQIGFFRIIHTRQTETSRIVPYTTLSHCWGKIDLLKLSNQTEGQLRAGVSNLVLPQTFQDAIQVSLTIGVNYLWIDFLCIYQDSSSDWDKESGLMGAVYSNSVLNIAATSARDGNGGLFSKRRLALYQGCRVQSLWTDTTNREWLVQPATIERLLLDGPLLYRGWVIQERFLAPRVLHFGATGLYWECRQRDACLSYPDGISGDTLKFRFKSLYEKLQVPSDKFDSMVHYTENILHAWGVFVMYYTECDLSMEKDKLVAISGVAKVFQIKCGGMEYLAGLWRQNLVQTLCWYLWNPGRRPQEYRAPSWAWASIEGPVTLKSNISGNRDLAQIVEVSVEHKTSDVTGEVKGGLIRLQGYLMTIVSNTRGSVAILTVNGTSNACHFYCRDTVVDGKKLHCMPMVQWLDGETAECLVLEPVDSIRGKFRRYGFMWLSYDDFGIESWDKIQNEDWIEFEADTRDGKYTISII